MAQEDNSTRRDGYDRKKYAESWERIFGKKKDEDKQGANGRGKSLQE